MKAFVDTSSLIKKYVAEEGSREFESELEFISEIIVAPFYWVELNAAIERRVEEKTLSPREASLICREAEKDLIYFGKVIWSELLEKRALEIIRKYYLKTLDSLQLASGMISQADLFLTSDKNLYDIASRELENTKFI